MRSFLIITVLLWLSSPVYAQTTVTSYTIYGIVRLPNGETASRVIVKITSQSGLDRQIFTDDMGRYEMRDLPRGRYQITAINPADPDQMTDPAEADTVRSFGSRLLVHLYLRTRAASGSQKSRAGAPVISVGEAAQRVPKDAQKAFDHALRMRSERKLPGAIENLDKAIELYPAYFQAYAERGHMKIGLGQTAEAARDFAEALRLNAQYEPALRGSGICKIEQGKLSDAIADLEAAAVLNPNVSSTHLFLGVASLALDRRDPARAALHKALTLDSAGAIRAHVHLASLYMKENRLGEAADQLKAYLTAVPNAPDAEKLRALESQLRVKSAKEIR